MKPYRPSGAFEGMDFMARFCDRCQHEKNEPCDILTTTFFEPIDSPNYPKEWVQDEKGPRCTAFEEDA